MQARIAFGYLTVSSSLRVRAPFHLLEQLLILIHRLQSRASTFALLHQHLQKLVHYFVAQPKAVG